MKISEESRSAILSGPCGPSGPPAQPGAVAGAVGAAVGDGDGEADDGGGTER